MTNHIDEYDEKTVEEVQDAVRDGSFTNAEIGEILEYEAENEDRVTLTEWLDNRYDPSLDQEPQTITVEAGTQTGNVAGVFFDYIYQHKTVENRTRVKQAIENGDLRRID